MTAISYVGKSRLHAAQHLLPDILRKWRTDWCLGDPTESITAVVAGTGQRRDLSWRIATTPAGALMLGARSPASWYRLLFGQQVTDVPLDDIAEQLMGEAQLALINAILSAAEQDPSDAVLMETDISVASCRPRIELVLPAHASELCILLDASLFDAWLPIPASRTPLRSRQHALGGTRLTLTLMLPLSELSAASLAGLQPGDIVQTTTPLSQPVHLHVHKVRRIASGLLMQRDGRVALQLTHEGSTGAGT